MAHLYRLRASRAYRERRIKYQATRPTPVSIGEGANAPQIAFDPVEVAAAQHVIAACQIDVFDGRGRSDIGILMVRKDNSAFVGDRH